MLYVYVLPQFKQSEQARIVEVPFAVNSQLSSEGEVVEGEQQQSLR